LTVACFSPERVTPSPIEDTSSSSAGASPTDPIVDDSGGMSPGDDGTSAGPSETSAGPTSADTSGGTDDGESGDVGAIPCYPYDPSCPPGRKCTAIGLAVWDAFACMPIDPDPVGVGAPCTAVNATSGLDDCEEGSICFNLDPVTHEGTCVAFCDGSSAFPECPEGEQCIVYDDFLPLCRVVAAGCGDGSAGPGEQCDGDDLQGFDCASLGLPGGELVCDPLQCTFDTSGCGM
jgi:hypothetical protein